MMLWKKESNEPGALYVNIFPQENKEWLDKCYASTLHVNRSMRPKNDTVAELKRKLGNVAFGKRKWSIAMKLYNDSLRNAKKGSELISLAYANRSTCFLHIKMYNECLVDIELAKAAGYPDHLMPKLDRRKAECLERIAEAGGGAASDDFGLKLSYDPDEKFPCMANALKIERDAHGEYMAYAKEDIGVGKTIVVEKAFSTHLFKLHESKCNICLKTNTNLVPCDKCTMAMFCKDGCNGHYLHESECGLKLSDVYSLNGVIMHNMRITLMAINMFSNADELMDFVEQTIASDQNELPENLLDEKSQYRAFLKLPISAKSSDPKDFLATIFCAYKTVLTIQKMQSMFQTEKHHRFLMHLIALHGLISMDNSIRSATNVRNERVDICCHTAITKRFFQHSCAPNVLFGDRDGRTVYITIRPVKKGEQLHTFALNILKEPKRKRQQMLSQCKSLTCKCSRCEGETATPQQRRVLTADPDYYDILSIPLPDGNDEQQLRAPTDKCTAFLNKHGRMPWCPELGNVIEVYTGLLRLRLNDYISVLDLELSDMDFTDE